MNVRFSELAVVPDNSKNNSWAVNIVEFGEVKFKFTVSVDAPENNNNSDVILSNVFCSNIFPFKNPGRNASELFSSLNIFISIYDGNSPDEIYPDKFNIDNIIG